MDEKTLRDLNFAFKRIFAMPITRSTFREIQNTIVTATHGDTDAANSLFEALLTGDVKRDLLKNGEEQSIKDFIEQFTISTRTARDVFENGEFINLVTSDILTRQNRLAFFTRIRRVDGQEIQFITDPEGTLNIIQHFLGRLQEIKKNPQTKKVIEFYKDKLDAVKQAVEELSE